VVYTNCSKVSCSLLAHVRQSVNNPRLGPPLLLLPAGAALGGAAIQTLPAQAKPHAYVIEVTIKDQDGFSKEFARRL
jgi:hypothetical protein